ncbi:MAG TPA: inositol monophosphatase family protein [Candidatus Paceibacterota bacterium]|nr:inositol monophosphatase family protein [Candidatus Paceibacterota bacterium]
MNLQPYFTFARQLAYRAGRITLSHYNKGIQHDRKKDESPVTAADRATEEFIRGEIEKYFPTHAIMGEEFGASNAGIRDSASPSAETFRWIVDPIDGTKSFIKGVPFYSVLIALEIEGVSRVGAVCFPALDEILYAADGLGCWWNGKRVHVSEVSDLKEAVFCYTSWSGFRTQKRLKVFERLHKEFFYGRGWSDAYGYHMVATGRAEVMLDPSIEVWDVAPFAPIMREAGGYFGSWSGEEGHTHGEGMACNAALKSQILELTRVKEKE